MADGAAEETRAEDAERGGGRAWRVVARCKQRVLRLRFDLDPGRWSAIRTIGWTRGLGDTTAAWVQDAFVGLLHLAHHAGVYDAARHQRALASRPGGTDHA